MFSLVSIVLLVAVAAASPSGRYGYAQPVAVVEETHKVIPGGTSSQYHSQGAYGDYAYGYADPNSRKHEVGTYGGVKGSYAYIAPDGTPVVNEYYADDNGFRSNLAPTAPFDVYPEPDYSQHVVAHPAPVAHHATHTVAHAPAVAHHSTHTVAHAPAVAHHATVAHAPAVAHHSTHAIAPVAHHASHTTLSHAAPVVASHTVAHAAPLAHHASYGVAHVAAPAISRHVSYVSHPPVYARYAPAHSLYPLGIAGY